MHADLDLRPAPVAQEPFPHVVRDGFLPEGLYRALLRSFPECPPSSGPSGHGLFWGDPGHEELRRREPAWQAFFEAVQSQRFVDHALAQFADTIRAGCLVDLSRARHVAHAESREDKERAHLAGSPLEPDALFVRLDIHQARRGYDRDIHVDHRRRLISMLIYFCDEDEARMVGGNVVLEPSATGWPPWRRRSVALRHNRMVAFPCTPGSFHAVPAMVFSRQDRRYVQIQVSSAVDLWREPGPPPGIATLYQRLRDTVPARVARRAVRELRRTVASRS